MASVRVMECNSRWKMNPHTHSFEGRADCGTNYLTKSYELTAQRIWRLVPLKM